MKYLIVLAFVITSCAYMKMSPKEIAMMEQRKACDAVCLPFQTYVCKDEDALCYTAKRDIFRRKILKEKE